MQMLHAFPVAQDVRQLCRWLWHCRTRMRCIDVFSGGDLMLVVCLALFVVVQGKHADGFIPDPVGWARDGSIHRYHGAA